MAMGENRIRYFRRERRKPFLAFVIFCCAVFIPSIFCKIVSADIGDPVQTIANPGNTTITVFDYYIYDSNWNSAANANTTGINQGHVFLFSRSTSSQPAAWNRWTGKDGAATQHIVKPLLENGYPVLNCLGGTYVNGVCTGGNEESLSYLFTHDPINVTTPGGVTKPVKKVYEDVGELFTVDDEGHYVFNSDKENAILYKNEDHNSWEFNITEQEKQEDDDLGFFPLSNGIKPVNSKPDGWFFGVHIHNDFSIPYDGKVLNPSGEYQDMIFEFSGDDDVWVYIDGILIGDVGGIHSKEYLSINFVTGEVIVKNPRHESGTTFKTTIYDMVVQAIGKEEADKLNWKEEESGDPKTFAGNTYHTLDFFYLERGGGNSNMQMRFNLISTYDFTAHKTLRLNKYDDIGHKLEENQFRYRLTGYPITITDDEGSTTVMEPVMPQVRTDRDVYWEPDYDETKTLIEENEWANRNGQFIKSLVIGNSLDGNINFGNRDLESEELAVYSGKTFRYMIEELPPAGAVPNGGTYEYQGRTISQNPDGSYSFEEGRDPIIIDFSEPAKMPPPGAKYHGSYSYKGEIISPDDDGKYTFDGIIYDNKVFYYKGTVGSPPEGWISKIWYDDENYSVESAIKFANFDNRYDSIGDAVIEGNKKYYKASGVEITPLTPNQFDFMLTDVTDPDHPVVKQPVIGKPPAENASDGHFSFDPISYKLADDIPAGESEAVYIYKIEEIPGNERTIIYSDEVYYARVTLTDQGNGKLSVDVRYYGKCGEDICQEEIPKTQVIFTNKNKTNLTIDKTVNGNIGSRNKDFDFSLTMPEMMGKTVPYTKVSRNGTAATDNITFSSDGIASFNLKHGEKITLYDIDGAFTVEEAVTPEGYTVLVSSDSPETKTGGRTADGSVTSENESVTVSYTNTLEVAPPTGIRDDLAPALAGIAAAGLMLLTLWTGKKREENG